MTRNLKILFLTSLFFLGLSTTVSISKADDGDKIYIKVGEANVQKSLIAIPPFLFLSSPSGAANYKSIGTDLFNTVTNDLDTSNLFTIIKQAAYPEDTTKTGLTPAPGN